MYNKVLGYNLLIRPRVQLYLYSGIKYNKMVTLGLSRVDRKSQGSLELVSYLFPFGPTQSHILKHNWKSPKR